MKKYNVLWLFSDQHRAMAMGMNGDPNAVTPNLDALARDAVSFDRTYSISPLCSPFRASLYTGRHICCHGVTSLHVPPRHDLPMVPQLMRRAGYHTAHFGKWHLSGGACPSHFVSPYFRPGWDEWYGWENSNRPFETAYSRGDTPQMYVLPGYQTDCLTDMVLRWLRDYDREKPWFLVWSVEPPHAPHVAPEEDMAFFSDRPIRFRENVPPERRDLRTENELRGYYAQIRNLDRNIGRILEELKRTGQYDDTIIMYFSDHGEFLGSFGRDEKMYAQNESSQIPLIIRHPDMERRGVRSDALVSSLDITPTVFGLAGLEIPDFDGKDLTDIVLSGEGEANTQIIMGTDNRFLTETDEFLYRALMDRRYLYIKAARPSLCALYDMDNDPFQMNDLLPDERYAGLAGRMDARLRQTLSQIHDDFYSRIGP